MGTNMNNFSTKRYGSALNVLAEMQAAEITHSKTDEPNPNTMQTYAVIIPIAGHITYEVEAENEKEAEEKAWDMNPKDGDLDWEQLEKFNSGNVCYCPSPWRVTVEPA